MVKITLASRFLAVDTWFCVKVPGGEPKGSHTEIGFPSMALAVVGALYGSRHCSLSRLACPFRSIYWVMTAFNSSISFTDAQIAAHLHWNQLLSICFAAARLMKALFPHSVSTKSPIVIHSSTCLTQ